MYNDEAVKRAWESAKNPPVPGSPEAYKLAFDVYAASKTEAEKACWKFVEEEKPGFVFNTVLPNMNLGPVLDKNQTSRSAGWMVPLINNTPEVEGMIAMIGPREFSHLNLSLSTSFPLAEFVRQDALCVLITPLLLNVEYFVDVRDTGRLHVAALTNPNVKSERIFAFAAPFNWTDIFTILRKLFPDRKIHDDIPNEPRDLSTVKTWDRSVELLKALGQDGFITLEDSVKANAEAFT